MNNDFGFWMVPKVAFEDLRLKHGEAGLLGILVSLRNGENKSFPSQKWLSERLSVDSRTVRRYLDTLVECGYLNKEQRGNNRSNVYTINDDILSQIAVRAVPSIKEGPDSMTPPDRTAVSVPLIEDPNRSPNTESGQFTHEERVAMIAEYIDEVEQALGYRPSVGKADVASLEWFARDHTDADFTSLLEYLLYDKESPFSDGKMVPLLRTLIGNFGINLWLKLKNNG